MYREKLFGYPTAAETLAQRTAVGRSARDARANEFACGTSLEALYAEHRGAAFALAFRMLGERGLAEDAVQEAFLNIWRQGGTEDTARGTARAWLLTIVHHRAIDLMRGRRAKAGADTVIDAAVPLPSGEDTWATVAEHLESDRIHEAIATLPREQRQVIELSYFGGLTNAEIATRIGVPLGTVKGRLRLALEKLRCVLMQETRAEAVGTAA
jgi:RNA polymerase sigma-70 factor, ECF subfamily